MNGNGRDVVRHYYNEFDPKAAGWLRSLISAGLIPEGVVDERSITEVQPADLMGYVQHHFFAGIGGWSLALRLAGWPAGRRVWTGSCPCQPFSTAGKRKGKEDERHLWPVWFDLIRGYNAISQREPVPVFGEQVASAIRHGWLDGVCGDMEGENYTVGHAVLGAHSLGAPHIRQRLYWVGAPNSRRWSKGWLTPKAARYRSTTESAGGVSGLGIAIQQGLEGHSGDVRDGHEPRRLAAGEAGSTATASTVSGVVNTTGTGQRSGQSRCDSKSRIVVAGAESRGNSFDTGAANHWSDFDLIPCRDGKTRRVKSGVCCLAHGIPGRVAQLRGLGNAIVPQVASEFIQAYMQTGHALTSSSPAAGGG